MTRKSRTLKQALSIAAAKSIVLTGVLAFALFGFSNGSASPMQVLPNEGPVAGSDLVASQLLVQHGCWNGEAPADMKGQMPSHVVVSVDGGTARYAGRHMVGQAFDQLFNGVDHGLTVHGFCR